MARERTRDGKGGMNGLHARGTPWLFMWLTHLARVHLKLADDFDRNVLMLTGAVLCSVDVAEGAVAHLLDENPSLQTRISGQLSSALPLLGHDPLQDRRIVVGLSVGGSGVLLDLLVVAGRPRSRVSGSCGDVAVVERGDRVICLRHVGVQRLVVHHIWIAESVVLGLVAVTLLLGVHIGDVRRRLRVRLVGGPSLLAVADEVF